MATGYDREDRAAAAKAEIAAAERKRKKKKVVKKKAPPLPVPSLTIEYENVPAPPPPRRAGKPTMMDRKPGPGPKHLPTKYEYLPPEQLLNRVIGVETAEEKATSKRRNQIREAERRADLRLARQQRAERREQIREMRRNGITEKFFSRERAQRYIERGEAGGGFGLPSLGEVAKGAFDLAEWWITDAPDQLLGEYDKDKGKYVGGFAERWDNMSTQEQIDTIMGGKSFANVLQGQGLTPKNIASAVAMAAMLPVPFGKGLPSLASVLMRGGMNAKQVEHALRTGKGLREGLEAAKTPIRPVKRTRAALAARKKLPSTLRPIAQADAQTVASWGPAAARVGREAMERREMHTMALDDADGNLRAVAAYLIQGDTIVIRHIAGAGKGGGRAMMKEIAQEAADRGYGIRLISESPESDAFYQKLGMKKLGKSGYAWEPEEAAAFAKAPTPQPGKPLVGLPEKGQMDSTLRLLADEYMAAKNARHMRPTQYVSASPERGSRIAKAYDEMPDAAKGEGSPAYRKQVERSYNAFREETADQYAMLMSKGYQFEFMPVGQDPYGNSPWGAMRDLGENQHMYVFPTDEGFGTLEEAGSHPLLEVVPGLTWAQRQADGTVVDKPVTYNDLFRAVHDVFGHKKEGVGFRADGEENAWRSHVAMYSDEAKGAMTAETRGQNSWVNFGPYGEANQTASQMDTVYADQKAGIMPDWTWKENPDGVTDLDVQTIVDDFMTEGLPLPRGINNAEELAQAIAHYHHYTVLGAALNGRDWYERAAMVVKETADLANQHPNVVSGKTPPITYAQMSQVFAILSATDNTVNNVSQVAKAMRGWLDHGDVFAGKYPTRASDEIMSVLNGKGASWVDDDGDLLTWAGRKRTSFHMNIIEHLDGEEYARLMAERPFEGDPVTVDMWIARIFGVEQPAKKDYTSYERIIQHMARQVDWHPKEVQAAGWVGAKDEGIELSFKEAAETGKRPNYLLAAAGAADAFEYGFGKQFEQMDLGIAQVNPRAARAFNRLKAKKSKKNPGAGGFSLKPDLTINDSKTGYTVSLAPYETRIPLSQMYAAHIEGYRDAHKKVLTRGHYLGGWLNEQDGMVYLDISKKFRNREEALAFGREQGQIAIWDAKAMDEIPTGLTPEEADAIKARLRSDIEFEAQRGKKKPHTVSTRPEAPLEQAEKEYRSFLDDIVRGSGKGKRGVTEIQREEAERQTLRLAEQYMDDPDFDEFWRLYEAAHPVVDTPIPFGEAGFLNPSKMLRQPVPTRTLRLNEKVQQLPAARSAFTRTFIERPADWASDKLMAEESKAADILNAVFRTASAERRVAKAAGREQMVEASRANAKMMNHISDLPDAGSPSDLAHFYWAQLPADQRNVEGLKLVRDRQLQAADDITSGRVLDEVTARIDELTEELNETGDLSVLTQLGEMKALAADLPQRLEDIAVSVAKLNRVIAKPPKYDPQVVEAVRALSRERKAILLEAGVLKPEIAADRESLLSRWLDLTPSGEEVFIGHRMSKVRGASPSLMPQAPGVGRPRTPQGARQQNKLVLANTGRVRASTHVAAEDWQAAQTYRSALTSRDDLALMGKPFEGRLPEGHLLVNPKGRAIPPHAKTLPKLEEMDDDEIREVATDMVKGFLAEGNDVEGMLAEAKAMGIRADELRVIPEDTVKRYFGQFTSPGRGTAGGRAYDAAVDFTAASIVFARVGYIPKNIAQNLIISMPHQGPFMLFNVPRAAQAILDPDLRHLLHAEVGFSGATQGLGEELRHGQKLRGLPGTVAGWVGKIADDPARMAAFIHEAAAAGVIRRYSAHLNQQDRANLYNLLTNPEMRPLLNDVRSRSVEAMADFSRLTPTQRRWARRFLIIPGWLWAGSRYPFHFAATHPGRSAAIAYVVAGMPASETLGLPDTPSAADIMSDNLPDFIEGIDIPDSFPLVGGKTFRTTSLSPVSTPYEIALALGGQSPDTAVSYANPFAKAVYNMAARRKEYPGGSYGVGQQEAIIANLEKLLPNWTFVEHMVRPEESSRYPDDESRLQRFFRELGVVPIKIRSDTEADTDDWVKEAERLAGSSIPEHALNARKAHVAHTEAEREFKDEHNIEEGGLTPQERLAVLVRTQAKLNPDKADEAKAKEEQAMGLTDDDAEDAITAGRERLGLTLYEQIQDRMSEARTQARTESGMRNAGQHDG
jgi:hypothetical protein